MTVLTAIIVDYERLARENLKRMLAAYPQVEVVGMARNASEARRRLQAKRPDVVFLDIRMPVLDGLAAVRLIQEHFEPRDAGLLLALLLGERAEIDET